MSRLPFLLCFLVLGTSSAIADSHDPIEADSQAYKLVLQITVDGLRGDQLERFKSGFGKRGFRLLMDSGTVFTNAHYKHANTETIVGHTTLATGATPFKHGMIGNAWFDRDADSLGYNIEDPEAPLIKTRETETRGEQVDPAQKASRSDGRSPKAILAPTLSDSLASVYGDSTKIFAVSGKDRGAVSMAGSHGKAFWYSTNNGDFTSSTFYFKHYPEWVNSWNSENQAAKHAGTSWNLPGKYSDFLLGAYDDRSYEVDLKGYGKTFPHPFGAEGDKLLFTRLLVSPVGDRLVANFAKKLILEEKHNPKI